MVDPEALIERAKDIGAWLHRRGNRDERVIQNYAVAAAGYDFFVRDKDGDFMGWLECEVRRSREEKEDEAVLPQFLDDICELFALGKLDNKTIHRGTGDPNHFWIHFKRAYSAWQEYSRARGREGDWTKRTLKKYLAEETWVLDDGTHKFGDGTVRHAVKCVFDEAPIEIQQLVMDEFEQEKVGEAADNGAGGSA